jgi:UDP:flavonoid glycosyltransferase YjiC (YdhE family)
MKIAIVTYGTEGDTRPLAALGRALIDAGHEIRLLADRSTLEAPVALHVPSMPLSGDIRRALVALQATGVEKAGGFRDTAKALTQIVNDNTAAWMREVVDAAQGCDAIMTSGLAAFVGFSVAEYLDIKAVGAGLIPISPTANFPSPFLPPHGVPRWLNRSSHRLVNGLLWQAFRKATNAARVSVCSLPPQRGNVWSDVPMLFGVSPSLLGTPQDWPVHVRACGQWSMEPPQWIPSPELEAFLAQGEPPVYVGFGSMAGLDRGQLMQTVVATLAGRRALFYPGWSDLDTSALPKNICVIGDTPHHWLFPRTSMVIHHGGSGTTHSAARAGVPSVVVPFAGDQFFWADRLKQLGVAGAPVSGKRVRHADLARCIDFAQRDDVKARAAELGARMAAEDGLALAVALAEKWLAEPGMKTG